MASWHHSTESASERGYGAAWARLRQQVIARDLGLCQSCLRQGRTTPGRDVDHIVPKVAPGSTDDLGNLQLLCEPCHLDKTAREQGKRRRPPRGPDGWSIEEGRYVGPLTVLPKHSRVRD